MEQTSTKEQTLVEVKILMKEYNSFTRKMKKKFRDPKSTFEELNHLESTQYDMLEAIETKLKTIGESINFYYTNL